MGLAEVASPPSQFSSTIEASNDNNANSALESHVKEVIEERTDEHGQRVRITRKVRLRLVSEKVSKEVVRRGREWRKFGDATHDGPGPNLSSTIVGEPVYLKLSSQGGIGDQENESGKTGAVVQAKNIVCRYCQGAHWSAKCPYKSTFASEGDNTSGGIISGSTGEMMSTGAGLGDSSRSQKYIPPSLRRSMEQATGSGAVLGNGTAIASRPENPNTVRLSNLSDIVTEADLRDLVNRIATPSRIYVVRDQRTLLCRGSAYISFLLAEDAERVIQKLNGHLYGNLVMHAEMAKPQQP